MMVGDESENAIDDVLIVPGFVGTADARGLVHVDNLGGKNGRELAHFKLLDSERVPGVEGGFLPDSKPCA